MRIIPKMNLNDLIAKFFLILIYYLANLFILNEINKVWGRKFSIRQSEGSYMPFWLLPEAFASLLFQHQHNARIKYQKNFICVVII